MTSNLELLQTEFPQFAFKQNLMLAPLTYFKIGGPAELFLELEDIDQVVAVVKYCANHTLPLTILGGASNVVIADEGISGLVLHLTNHQLEITDQIIEQKRVVRAGAGFKTSLLVSQVVEHGFSGLEYFLGVPGTLGGAIYNNAHYLADLIGQHIHRVQVITAEGELMWLSQAKCEFGYDSSRFHRTKEVIVAVEFLLATGDRITSKELIREATVYRAQTQPLGMPSSGCTFQNTPNTAHLKALFPQFAERSHLPAGFLIEQAGLKGARVGDIQISEKHAAFFINLGQGSANDVAALVEKVKTTVAHQFKVELREEVFYL